MDQFGKGIDVGRFEFAQIPITEDLQRKVMLERKFGQNIHIRGVACFGLLDHRQFQFVKEDLSQLLGRVDIEDLSGQSIDSFHLLLELGFNLFGKFLEKIQIDLHPIHLHLRQDDDERYLHLIKEIFKSLLLQFRKKEVRKLKCHIRILTTIVPGLFKIDSGQRSPALPPASHHLFVVGDSPIQIFPGDLTEVVVMFGRIEEVGGDHRIAVDPLEIECHIVSEQSIRI